MITKIFHGHTQWSKCILQFCLHLVPLVQEYGLVWWDHWPGLVYVCFGCMCLHSWLRWSCHRYFVQLSINGKSRWSSTITCAQHILHWAAFIAWPGAVPCRYAEQLPACWWCTLTLIERIHDFYTEPRHSEHVSLANRRSDLFQFEHVTCDVLDELGIVEPSNHCTPTE